MDPECPKCRKKLNGKEDINIEYIKGGLAEHGYEIMLVYCQKCATTLGVIPNKEWLIDVIKQAIK
jgi:hypothetical protein